MIYINYFFMKSVIHFYCISILFTCFLFSCNNSSDPVKDAKEENKEKIDSLAVQQHIDSATAAILPSKDDADFLVNAASGGMLEVQLGQLAQTNSQNQRIKDFGAMMMKDHGEGGVKLKALAAS